MMAIQKYTEYSMPNALKIRLSCFDTLEKWFANILVVFLKCSCCLEMEKSQTK